MTVVFTASSAWISRLIRWITGSTVSHVGIGTHLHGVPVVIHADVGGVQVSTRARFLTQRYLVAEFDCLSNSSEERMNAAVLSIGESYDYVGLLGFAVVALAWRWFRLRVSNPWASPRAAVCSEFVTRALDVPGLGDAERVYPSALLEACAASELFARRESVQGRAELIC